MSLASLCGIATATIKRNTSTQGSAGGQLRGYTTAGRGTLPTKSTGRLVQDEGSRRLVYEMHDLETDGRWFTVTDPQVNEQDLLVINGDNWFVSSTKNPDTLSRFFTVSLKRYTRGIQ